MIFAGNKALVGSAIYANGLDLCSWASYSTPYFNNTNQVLRWPIITYRYVHNVTRFGKRGFILESNFNFEEAQLGV